LSCSPSPTRLCSCETNGFALSHDYSSNWSFFLESIIYSLLIRKQKKTNIDIDWHVLFDLLLTIVPFPTATKSKGSFNGRSVEKGYNSALLSLIRQARPHFSALAGEEIMDHLRPYFAPHDTIIFTTQALLVAFLPTHQPYPELLDECMAMWDWMENTREWDNSWMSLLSRWAKYHHSNPVIQWEKYIPRLFQHFLRMFGM
jgi:hypothetical protein